MAGIVSIKANSPAFERLRVAILERLREIWDPSIDDTVPRYTLALLVKNADSKKLQAGLKAILKDTTVEFVEWLLTHLRLNKQTYEALEASAPSTSAPASTKQQAAKPAAQKPPPKPDPVPAADTFELRAEDLDDQALLQGLDEELEEDYEYEGPGENEAPQPVAASTKPSSASTKRPSLDAKAPSSAGTQTAAHKPGAGGQTLAHDQHPSQPSKDRKEQASKAGEPKQHQAAAQQPQEQQRDMSRPDDTAQGAAQPQREQRNGGEPSSSGRRLKSVVSWDSWAKHEGPVEDAAAGAVAAAGAPDQPSASGKRPLTFTPLPPGPEHNRPLGSKRALRDGVEAQKQQQRPRSGSTGGPQQEPQPHRPQSARSRSRSRSPPPPRRGSSPGAGAGGPGRARGPPGLAANMLKSALRPLGAPDQPSATGRGGDRSERDRADMDRERDRDRDRDRERERDRGDRGDRGDRLAGGNSLERRSSDGRDGKARPSIFERLGGGGGDGSKVSVFARLSGLPELVGGASRASGGSGVGALPRKRNAAGADGYDEPAAGSYGGPGAATQHMDRGGVRDRERDRGDPHRDRMRDADALMTQIGSPPKVSKLSVDDRRGVHSAAAAGGLSAADGGTREGRQQQQPAVAGGAAASRPAHQDASRASTASAQQAPKPSAAAGNGGGTAAPAAPAAAGARKPAATPGGGSAAAAAGGSSNAASDEIARMREELRRMEASLQQLKQEKEGSGAAAAAAAAQQAAAGSAMAGLPAVISRGGVVSLAMPGAGPSQAASAAGGKQPGAGAAGAAAGAGTGGQAGQTSGAVQPAQMSAAAQAELQGRTVIVTNLPFGANELALQAHFSVCGPINNVNVVYDDKGLPQAAVIEFTLAPSALQASLELTGSVFLDQPLTVVLASMVAAAGLPGMGGPMPMPGVLPPPLGMPGLMPPPFLAPGFVPMLPPGMGPGPRPFGARPAGGAPRLKTNVWQRPNGSSNAAAGTS